MAKPLPDLREIEAMCRRAPRSVVVWDKVIAEAAPFGIVTKDDAITFIRDGHAEDARRILPFLPLRNWRLANPPTVVAYAFCYGPLAGYLAFFRNPSTGNLTLKSLKPNRDLAEQERAADRFDQEKLRTAN